MSARSFIAAVALGFIAAGPALAGEVKGPVEVIDGTTMLIGGKQVQLADIVVPALGTRCVWNGQPLDCGVLARAGLKDLTAGADVVCTPVGSHHRCKDGTFDLAFGLIHAGWCRSRAHRRITSTRCAKPGSANGACGAHMLWAVRRRWPTSCSRAGKCPLVSLPGLTG